MMLLHAHHKQDPSVKPETSVNNVFPIGLVLQDRRCVIVGEGKEAVRRTLDLLGAGASVLIITPHATRDLQSLAQRTGVSLIQRAYRSGDLEGASLAILVNRDDSLAHRMATEAAALRLPFCAIDQPARCSFVHLSVARSGSLMVAVSTSGKAPALAARLKAELERLLEAANAAGFIEQVASLRERVPVELRSKLLQGLMRKVRLTGTLELPYLDSKLPFDQ
jgi:siroheme synthase-like protein